MIHNTYRWFSVIVVFAILWPGVSGAFERYNHVVKFDPYFSKYTKRYFGPGFNWKPFKAQAEAESRLKAEVNGGRRFES